MPKRLDVLIHAFRNAVDPSSAESCSTVLALFQRTEQQAAD